LRRVASAIGRIVVKHVYDCCGEGLSEVPNYLRNRRRLVIAGDQDGYTAEVKARHQITEEKKRISQVRK
jgi:hypothetical protein